MEGLAPAPEAPLRRAERLGHRVQRVVRPSPLPPPPGTPIQRARGGLEYTEGTTTTLHSHPGGGAGAGAAVAPAAAQAVGQTQIEAYSVADGADMGTFAGARRETNHELLRSGRIKLTNDDYSAEWIIEGHAANLAAQALIDQTIADITAMYGLRRDLRAFVAARAAAGHTTVLAPGGTGNLRVPGAAGLFVYKPGAVSTGKAQITAQYANVETIRRINELNASKFLTGAKVAQGEDAGRVAADPGFLKSLSDEYYETSPQMARSLLAYLVTNSANVAGGGSTLRAAQVGLIKLMVINDAMASTMSRHAAIIGEAQEKNVQRFFPKAERQTYVDAVAQANVPGALMAALRAAITANAATMAQAVWDRADPFALLISESTRERVQAGADTVVGAPAANLAAAAAAPAVAPATVTAAIAAVRAQVARDVGKGATALALTPIIAAAITAATAVAGPAATAIAGVLVAAAMTARNNVTGQILPLVATQQNAAAGQATTPAERGALKDFVLGNNGGILAGWIGRAVLAYTDTSGAAADHVNAAAGTGNVIRSTAGYTPLAGAGPGAVYEFREREIEMTDGNITAVRAALTALFGAVD